MSEERPPSLRAAADLRLLLRQLGQVDAPASRPALVENEREARMIAGVDAEVAKLQRERRKLRRLGTWLAAAAAVVAVGMGVRQVRLGPSSISIQQEPLVPTAPLPPQKVVPRPAAPRPPAPPPLPSSTPPKASAAPSSTPSPSASVAETVTAPLASAEPQSTLAEENRLFKAAAEASRSGDVSGAVARLDQLLVEHPRSPLAQTALVRKFRLLDKAGRREEAKHEAERYLASYPTGFAVSEAQALKIGQAPAPAPSQESSAP